MCLSAWFSVYGIRDISKCFSGGEDALVAASIARPFNPGTVPISLVGPYSVRTVVAIGTLNHGPFRFSRTQWFVLV